MTLKKLEPGALVGDQVFDAMHRAIINGELKAEQRLRIREVAAQLGTSVMPVREAIRRLEESGLVETIPYRGAVVRGFTAQELLDVYAVRMLLETEAARQGTARLNEHDVQLLQKEFSALRTALNEGRIADCLDHDEKFLGLIYSASGNPVLLESIERLWTRCRAYKLFGARRAVEVGMDSMLWEFQDQMLVAIAARDQNSMVDLTEQSIQAAMERVRQVLPIGETQSH